MTEVELRLRAVALCAQALRLPAAAQREGFLRNCGLSAPQIAPLLAEYAAMSAQDLDTVTRLLGAGQRMTLQMQQLEDADMERDLVRGLTWDLSLR